MAAKGKSNLARLIGYISLCFVAEEDVVKGLQAENIVSQGSTHPKIPWMGFDNDGEFSTPQGQIPISRLVDGAYTENFELSKSDNDILQTLFVYQRPDGSPWKIPFCRFASNHVYNPLTKELKIYIYVYFTRLVFELIADPAIKVGKGYINLND